DALAHNFQALKGALTAEQANLALKSFPRYLVLGPTGAGKTTAIRNANLRFAFKPPTLDGDSTMPTQHCDPWVVSGTALLLDTGGRYMADGEGPREWSQMLSELDKYVGTSIIQDALVVFPVDEWVQQDAKKAQAFGATVRARLAEVGARTG